MSLTPSNGTDRVYTVLSIDGGVRNLGAAVLKVYRHQVIDIVHVETLTPEKHVDRRGVRCVEHGMRSAQLHVIRMAIRDLIHQHQPDDIVIEDCYLGSFASAFEALVQCIEVVAEEAYRYNHYNGLIRIPPSLVKRILGVDGRSNDKELVRIAVAERIPDPSILNGLSEHAVDSIGIGIAYCAEPVIDA